MSSGSRADRRPWLIISKSEAEALYAIGFRASLRKRKSALPPVLARALRVIDRQLAYINDSSPWGEEPSIEAALERETGPR